MSSKLSRQINRDLFGVALVVGRASQFGDNQYAHLTSSFTFEDGCLVAGALESLITTLVKDFRHGRWSDLRVNRYDAESLVHVLQIVVNDFSDFEHEVLCFKLESALRDLDKLDSVMLEFVIKTPPVDEEYAPAFRRLACLEYGVSNMWHLWGCILPEDEKLLASY